MSLINKLMFEFPINVVFLLILRYNKISSKEKMKMYLIVGLGNPEDNYSKTRHNMGFNVINKLSEKYDIEVNKSKFNNRK